MGEFFDTSGLIPRYLWAWYWARTRTTDSFGKERKSPDQLRKSRAFWFFCCRTSWSLGISWSPWDWRLFSRGRHSALWSSLNSVRGSTCDQPGKIPWNTPPWSGIEPGPQEGQTKSYPIGLPRPRPLGGQTVSYPTELSWPWPLGGQTVSYPTELSWPGPLGGQTLSYPTELSRLAFWHKTTKHYPPRQSGCMCASQMMWCAWSDWRVELWIK